MVVDTKMGWKLYQMEVRTTFLNGVVQEEVYVEQPQGFEEHDRETHVQIKECLIWIETSPKNMVQQNQWIFEENEVHQE